MLKTFLCICYKQTAWYQVQMVLKGNERGLVQSMGRLLHLPPGDITKLQFFLTTRGINLI